MDKPLDVSYYTGEEGIEVVIDCRCYRILKVYLTDNHDAKRVLCPTCDAEWEVRMNISIDTKRV